MNAVHTRLWRGVLLQPSQSFIHHANKGSITQIRGTDLLRRGRIQEDLFVSEQVCLQRLSSRDDRL